MISILHINLILPLLLGRYCQIQWIKVRLISTTIVVSGIATWLQATLGTRLPLFQGSSFIMFCYVKETLNFKSFNNYTVLENTPDLANESLGQTNTLNSEESFYNIIQELQGGIILVALLKIFLGATGLIGWLFYFIGPLTVIPVLLLIGLSSTQFYASYCEKQWLIAALTIILIVIFSFVCGKFMLPCLSYKKGVGCYKTNLPIFKIIPIILAFIISWLLSGILTWTNVFPEKLTDELSHFARVDVNSHLIHETAWLDIPYPGQWGHPRFTLGTFLGCLPVAICLIIESIGNYIAAAEICNISPVPVHAVNRGILMEGISSLLAGIIGSGGMVTTYSQATGNVIITKVASRKISQWIGIVTIFIGLFTKLAGLLSCIPEPVLGGALVISLAMMISMGLSLLENINLKSSRNLAILGFTVLFGLSLPKWLHDNSDAVFTGYSTLDQAIRILLSSPVFVGGSAAFCLDNVLPGSFTDRGITAWRTTWPLNEENSNTYSKIFSLPYVCSWTKKWKWTHHLPFLPSYQIQPLSCFLSSKSLESYEIANKNQIHQEYVEYETNV